MVAAHACEGGAGEREGVINKTCHDAVPGRVPECPGHQGCPGLLLGYFGVKTNEKKKILRFYGIEGEASREGEGFTRIHESTIKSSPVSKSGQ